MSNIWYSKSVDTIREYKNFEDFSGITLQEDKRYSVQAVGVITFCISATKPQEGGYTIFDNSICIFDLKNGEKLWVKTHNKPVSLNLGD